MSPACQIFNFKENFMFYDLDQFSSKVPRTPNGPMLGSLSYFIML